MMDLERSSKHQQLILSEVPLLHTPFFPPQAPHFLPYTADQERVLFGENYTPHFLRSHSRSTQSHRVGKGRDDRDLH